MYSFNAMLPQICPRSLLSDFVLRHILRSDHICVMRCGLEVDRVLLLQASAVCGEALLLLLVVLAGPCHSNDSNDSNESNESARLLQTSWIPEVSGAWMVPGPGTLCQSSNGIHGEMQCEVVAAESGFGALQCRQDPNVLRQDGM